MVMITQDELKRLLSYDPETGEFRWKSCPWNKTHLIGAIAGTELLGYTVIRINSRGYKAHRLAWLYVYGELPSEIDHINCVKSDNRIANLRPCTKSANGQNTRKRPNLTSQYKGVSLRRLTGKWKAGIDAGGRKLHLGYYDTQEAAYAAYCEAARKHHGEFARLA
jgi:hypothetical protein